MTIVGHLEIINAQFALIGVDVCKCEAIWRSRRGIDEGWESLRDDLRH